MITVKLFGLLRLDTGIRELQLEAQTVNDVHTAILNRTDAVTRRDLEGCIVMVNGKKANKRTRLNPGDEVTLLSPVAGG